MKYCFRKAEAGEEAQVYSMILRRIEWMDEVGIHQWNETGYPDVYPPAYYRENLDRMYVLENEDGKLCCAGILYEEDKRWPNGGSALYLHHLVAEVGYPGAGSTFIRKAEELAAELGKDWLRLDSAENNPKLGQYYETLGYTACGSCRDGAYRGLLRQKSIKKND